MKSITKLAGFLIILILWIGCSKSNPHNENPFPDGADLEFGDNNSGDNNSGDNNSGDNNSGDNNSGDNNSGDNNSNSQSLRNILKNGGFEEDDDFWDYDETLALVTKQASYKGEYSMYLSVNDPDNSKAITQSLEVVPGDIIWFSGYIKGQDLRGSNPEDEGVSICVESFDKDGKWLGGWYPPSLSGTFDWMLLDDERSYKIPDGTTNTIIELYLRGGTTGEVWFDEVVVEMEGEDSGNSDNSDNSSNEVQDEVVVNPGFEKGDEGWIIPAPAEIVSNESYAGNNSLFYNNQDPDQYISFAQDIQVFAGDAFTISAYVKGKDLRGLDGDEGASISIESYDEEGNWLAGWYLPNLSGTFDWTKLEDGHVYQVPQNTINTKVGLYLRRGTTGSVWFDNIDVDLQ